MIMSEWREVTGDSTRKCVCVPARLLRGSRVKAVWSARTRGWSVLFCQIVNICLPTLYLLLSGERWRDFFPTLTPSSLDFSSNSSEHTLCCSSSVLLLLKSQHSGYPVGLSFSVSLRHKQTHTPTHTRSAPTARSTQHHLWMFYPQWRLPWRCGLIGPWRGGGEEEERETGRERER